MPEKSKVADFILKFVIDQVFEDGKLLDLIESKLEPGTLPPGIIKAIEYQREFRKLLKIKLAEITTKDLAEVTELLGPFLN